MSSSVMARRLSVNEAACVTGVPLEQVHRIIDAGLPGGFERCAVTVPGDAPSSRCSLSDIRNLRIGTELRPSA